MKILFLLISTDLMNHQMNYRNINERFASCYPLKRE